MNEDLYLFPTFTQNYTWTKERIDRDDTDESITFQTDQGLSVNADVGISYAVDRSKVTTLFQKYRKDINEITGYLSAQYGSRRAGHRSQHTPDRDGVRLRQN